MNLQDIENIRRIIDRVGGDPMDLVTCIVGGCPLDLQRMRSGSDIDMIHDVSGIADNINYATGQLENCFRPRYAKHKDPEDEPFAEVRWMVEDVRSLRPDWMAAKCLDFISYAENTLRDRTIEQGWEIMECLLEMFEDKGGDK